VIKPLAISLSLSVVIAGAAVAIVGANLGGAFAIVATAMLVCPIAASALVEPRRAWLVILSAGAGAALVTIALLSNDAFAFSQVLSIAATAFAVGVAAGSLVRLLIRIRVAPLIASATVITLSLAWLAWPIWLSPWLSSDVVATRLAAVHPLMSINAIAPQFGYWIQMKQMYRLTTLGQDVLFTLPVSVVGCVLLHGVIAIVCAVELIVRRPTSPRSDVLPSRR